MTTVILKNYLFNLVKKLSLFSILLVIVLALNHAVISFNFFYPEQPTLYLANQKILHFQDLIHIYLHPQWLHSVIPFFRPSGHFLIYQLVTPILGWHNTQALIILNLIFLALTGSMIIANYKLLFPQFETGAYVAFAFYLMHPALSLSRFTILHFEFAYTFLFLFSLYCFQIFCKKNLIDSSSPIRKIQFHHFYYLALALFFYVFAVTFKEPAIILGPILFIYILLALYQNQKLFVFLKDVLQHPHVRQILILLTILTITLAFYLTLPWPTLAYPTRSVTLEYSYGAINELINAFLGTHIVFFKKGILLAASLAWRSIVFTPVNFYLTQFCLSIALLGFLLIFLHKTPHAYEYKKSLLFLILSSFLCLALPILWAVGAPWHLNLTLIFFGMWSGVSIEYLCHSFIKKQIKQNIFMILLALFIAITAIPMNQANLEAYQKIKTISLGLSLNRNAIQHPPAIKNQLNKESLLIVEDSLLLNDYIFGNANYPFLLLSNAIDFDQLYKLQTIYFMKYQPIYGGNLFKWAYLMPQLKEEVYPFSMDNMDSIPNEIIYAWLKHYPNIFCLGYTDSATWIDKTFIFRKNLLNEKYKRNMITNTFEIKQHTEITGKRINNKVLNIPDPQLCEFTCDQDPNCSGFTYRDLGSHYKICEFYQSSMHHFKSCSTCESYTKIR